MIFNLHLKSSILKVGGGCLMPFSKMPQDGLRKVPISLRDGHFCIALME